MNRVLLANGNLSGPLTCGFLTQGFVAASNDELTKQSGYGLWNAARTMVPDELVYGDEFDADGLPDLIAYGGFMLYIDQGRLQILTTLLVSQGKVAAARLLEEYHNKSRATGDLSADGLFRSEPTALLWQQCGDFASLIVDVAKVVGKNRELFGCTGCEMYFVNVIVTSNTFQQRKQLLSDELQGRDAHVLLYQQGSEMDLLAFGLFLSCASGKAWEIPVVRGAVRDGFIALGDDISEGQRVLHEIAEAEASVQWACRFREECGGW